MSFFIPFNPFNPPPSGGGPQGGPPPGPPGPNGNSPGGPPGPPPQMIPSQKSSNPQLKSVDSGAIKPCTYRYVYIYPERGRGYWAWLTYVGKKSVAGYRWNGFFWVYFGTDLKDIDSFVCY